MLNQIISFSLKNRALVLIGALVLGAVATVLMLNGYFLWFHLPIGQG